MTRRTCTWLGLAFAGVLASVAPAHAQVPPWSLGITDAQKASAQKFLEAGNALFLERKYEEALKEYQSAVGHWDHPAIRFNIVRCLIQLNRHIDASVDLKLALKYGAAPLEEAVYNEALSYEKLLATQFADVTIQCTQPNVKLTLDGKHLARCPAIEVRRVEPGQHQIVGTKDGLLTRTVEIIAIGGKQQSVVIKLDPLAKAARVEHRWSQWVPWGVFAGGFVVGGFGVMLNVWSVSDRDTYDAAVEAQCPSRSCPESDLPVNIQGLDDSSRAKNVVAISLMIAGGATVATGAVMLYMNRGRTVYPNSVERMTPSITPMPGGAAFTLSGAF
ncbi:MAG: tetratricopeptide repeat protein [Deltaproteobacteria bacterium]|nr:tetratricopeptide repeat protein [Deltaproteobacteria bacterium]